MEHTELVCLQPLQEFQVAPQDEVNLAEECLPQDAIRLVIQTENYQIEIEIY